MFVLMKDKNGQLIAKSMRDVDYLTEIVAINDNGIKKYALMLNKKNEYYYPKLFSNFDLALEYQNDMRKSKLEDNKWWWF